MCNEHYFPLWLEILHAKPIIKRKKKIRNKDLIWFTLGLVLDNGGATVVIETMMCWRWCGFMVVFLWFVQFVFFVFGFDLFFFLFLPPLSNFLFRNNPISNHKKYRFLLFFWVFHSLLFFSFPFSSFSSINSWLKIPSFLTQNSLSLSLSLSLSIYIYIYKRKKELINK